MFQRQTLSWNLILSRHFKLEKVCKWSFTPLLSHSYHTKIWTNDNKFSFEALFQHITYTSKSSFILDEWKLKSLKGALTWGFCSFLTQTLQKLLLMTFTHAKTFLEMQEKDINQFLAGKAIHSTFLAMPSRWRARIWKTLGYFFFKMQSISILAIHSRRQYLVSV